MVVILSCFRILKILPFRKLSRHDLEIGDLAQMLLYGSLVYEKCGRGILLALYLGSGLGHGLPLCR